MKKKLCFSLVTLALACLLAPGLSVPAHAATAALTPVTTATQCGLTYNKYEFERNGPQKLFTASLDPAAEGSELEVVLHHLEGADGGYRLDTVMAIAEDFEATTGRKVYAATNADFFAGSSPVDSYVKEGIVYKTGAYDWKHCFGFDNKGNAVIGRLTETSDAVTFTSADQKKTLTVAVSAWNKEPAEGGLAIYDLAGSYQSKNAVRYTAFVVDGALQDRRATGESRRTVEGASVSDGTLTVRSGEFGIVVKGDNEVSRWLYENFYYGATAFLHRAPAGKFAGMDYVTGGWCILVENGVVNKDCRVDLENSGGIPADRTFLGIKEDGTMMLCALDGRQSSYSKGLTVQQEADLAGELGLYTAIELDGGGSTTFLWRENDVLKHLNYSSEGSYPSNQRMRKVCTAVLVVEKAKAEQPGPGTDTPGTDTPEQPGTTEPGQPARSGCFSAITAQWSGAAVLLAAAAVLLLRDKKHGGIQS